MRQHELLLTFDREITSLQPHYRVALVTDGSQDRLQTLSDSPQVVARTETPQYISNLLVRCHSRI